ncbi:MAG: Crp/Fnr family transcriptional regulator [Flavobacteriales bacterium]|nr:Crp/Fnr family transcriptional regulator [Flavobacteriales bacterium]MBL4735668.1 Crp/Fnr family transcriptional regulator [Flavobacteriales bacterium]
MDQHLDTFQNFINRCTQSGKREFDVIESYFHLEEYKKGEHYTQLGSVSRKLGFLSEGIARTYFIDHSGQEITRRLAIAPSMISALKSFLTRKVSNENIIFLEDSVVLSIDYQNDQKLLQESTVYSQFRRIGIEFAFIELLNYLEIFLTEDAEQRYLIVLNSYPELVQRIPLHYLASLLGITPYSLSRIRKKVAKGH